MAATPLDPLWKFLLEEDSDEEREGRRRYRGGGNDNQRLGALETKKTVSFRKAQANPNEDDVSIIDLAMMHLKPREPEPQRRVLRRKPPQDNRDDEDSWSMLAASFSLTDDDQPGKREICKQRSDKKQNKSDEKERNGSVLHVNGLSVEGGNLASTGRSRRPGTPGRSRSEKSLLSAGSSNHHSNSRDVDKRKISSMGMLRKREPIFPEQEHHRQDSLQTFLPPSLRLDATGPSHNSRVNIGKTKPEKAPKVPTNKHEKPNLVKKDEKQEQRNSPKGANEKSSRSDRIKKRWTRRERAQQSQGDSNQFSAALVAAGAAAVGVAAGGALATKELFHSVVAPSPAAREISDSETDERRESRNDEDFWDMFSPSDEGSSSSSSFEESTQVSYETEQDSVASFVEQHDFSKKHVQTIFSEEMKDTPGGNVIRISVTSPDQKGIDSMVIKEEDEDAKESHVDENSIVIEDSMGEAPSRRGLGRIVCCSAKNFLEGEDFLTLERATELRGRGNHYVPVDAFPDVKMVPDNDEKSIAVGKGIVHRSLESHSVFAPETIAKSAGPQSLYTYEYNARTYLDVRYSKFGSNAREIMEVQNKTPRLFRKRESGEVLVLIEASTVSYTDCRLRRGEYEGSERTVLPVIPGVDFVGKVDAVDSRSVSRSGLKRGDRVMSLVKHGGNARFTKIDAERLVKVPGNLEPCEVVCLAETYLSAFQALHCGQRMATRYMRNSLSGKSIFVLGALTNVGRAVIELAEAGGATLIYAPCKAKYKERVRSLGATPLSPYKDEWMPLLHKKLDLIIDATIDTSEELENCFSILGEKGDYIFIGRTQKEIDRVTAVWVGSSNVVCSSKKVRMMNRIHAYDVFETWETNLESGKRDLSHLLKLLQEKAIKPRVLDRLSLLKVGKAHEVLDGNRLQGFLVCEPWIKSMSRAVYL